MMACLDLLLLIGPPDWRPSIGNFGRYPEQRELGSLSSAWTKVQMLGSQQDGTVLELVCIHFCFELPNVDL